MFPANNCSSSQAAHSVLSCICMSSPVADTLRLIFVRNLSRIILLKLIIKQNCASCWSFSHVCITMYSSEHVRYTNSTHLTHSECTSTDRHFPLSQYRKNIDSRSSHCLSHNLLELQTGLCPTALRYIGKVSYVSNAVFGIL
jgi:hypothetical protein